MGLGVIDMVLEVVENAREVRDAICLPNVVRRRGMGVGGEGIVSHFDPKESVRPSAGRPVCSLVSGDQHSDDSADGRRRYGVDIRSNPIGPLDLQNRMYAVNQSGSSLFTLASL